MLPVSDKKGITQLFLSVSSARLGYANRSPVDRLSQPASRQPDNWYQYFDTSFTIKQEETRPCEWFDL